MFNLRISVMNSNTSLSMAKQTFFLEGVTVSHIPPSIQPGYAEGVCLRGYEPGGRVAEEKLECATDLCS